MSLTNVILHFYFLDLKMPYPNLFVAIAIPKPIRNLFHYRLPMNAKVMKGSRVKIFFGSRKVVGVVMEVNSKPDIHLSKVKPILEVLNPEGDIPAPIIKLCLWASEYYHHPIGEVVAAAIPTSLRQGENPRKPIQILNLTAEGKSLHLTSLMRAKAQQSLVRALKQSGRTREELTALAISNRTIRALEKKNWATWREQAPLSPDNFSKKLVNQSEIDLSKEQIEAIKKIQTSSSVKPFLLFGITGSGKTEIYLRIIAPLLTSGKQVLILVPEIGLTPQTISRFQHRFNLPITVLHSGMNPKQRALGWLKAKEGTAKIILGTRSAIFTPLKSPGAIIVDEEHDASYKQQDGFRYSARDLAVFRARFEKIPIILGSATPSLESLKNAKSGKYQLLRLNARPPGVQPERYELLNTRHLAEKDGFTRQLQRQIAERLANNEQVLLFINRRGFSPAIICNDCGWIAKCARCDAKFTYHLSTQSLICHHCGANNRNIVKCQSCMSRNISPLGLGTQRIEKKIETMFPDFPVLRIDRDSTKRKGSLDSLISKVNEGKPAILIGTQLISKGHHFPDVTLVAILDIDSGFYSTDFKATEKLGQLILQVGGRSGRASKPGIVIIQTAFAENPLLTTLIEKNYSEFADILLKEREDADLPPFSFHAIVKSEAFSSHAATSFLDSIIREIRAPHSVRLLGPIPALMERKADKFRHLLVVASKDRRDLHETISLIISAAETSPNSNKIRWSVDVDPIDMF